MKSIIGIATILAAIFAVSPVLADNDTAAATAQSVSYSSSVKLAVPAKTSVKLAVPAKTAVASTEAKGSVVPVAAKTAQPAASKVVNKKCVVSKGIATKAEKKCVIYHHKWKYHKVENKGVTKTAPAAPVAAPVAAPAAPVAPAAPAKSAQAT